MFGFEIGQKALAAVRDDALYLREKMREERDDLRTRMMLNAHGRARLIELDEILG